MFFHWDGRETFPLWVSEVKVQESMIKYINSNIPHFQPLDQTYIAYSGTVLSSLLASHHTRELSISHDAKSNLPPPVWLTKSIPSLGQACQPENDQPIAYWITLA